MHDMDAEKHVALTMGEIKEIVYQLENALSALRTEEESAEERDKKVLHEKQEMLERIIEKVQG